MSKKLTEKELVEEMTPYTVHSDELAAILWEELSLEPSEGDYKAALKRIEDLIDAEPNTPDGDELEKLISLVEVYENEHYPI